MDAAFTLDGFHHNSADLGVFFAEFDERWQVIGRSIEEARCEGEEILVENVLACGGKGGNGAAVEPIDEGNDFISFFSILVNGVLPGSLDSAFIGFGTGVGKENLLHTGF